MLSYIPWVEALLIQASSFGLCEMASVFKARINPELHRPVNLKGVAGFKIVIELYRYKCRSRSHTTSTFSFNRLYKSNVQVHTIFLRNMVFVVTTRRAQVNSIGSLLRWLSFPNKEIITYHWREWQTAFLCVWKLNVKLTKNTSSDSQLFYKLEKKKTLLSDLP